MPLPPQTKQLIEDVINGMLIPYLDSRDDDSQPVVNYLDPPQMHERINKIMIEEGPSSNADIKKAIQETLDLSVKMGHKKCLNQLFHRADPIAILGDFVTSVMNTSIYTYELAPFITVLELEIIDKFAKLLAWPHNSPGQNEQPREVSGTMTPGGSVGNLYGLAAARVAKFPHVMQKGWQPEDKPVFFVSAAGHYSSKKSAGLLGIGYDAMIPVATDPETNTMNPAALRAAIAKSKAEGKTPFAVVITIGTTLTGASDPIGEVVKVCKDLDQNDVWLHVDGCLGGSLIHSPTQRNSALFSGIERVDSITINPHKMMGATLQTTVFMTQHSSVHQETFSTKAQYLFNADKQYDAATYDVGDQVFQCGRHVDVFKLFLMWKARGDVGMAKYVDDSIARNDLFNDVLRKRCTEFQPLLKEPSRVPCTCFFYVPKKLQKKASEVKSFQEESFPIYQFRKEKSGDDGQKTANDELFDVFEKIAPRAKLLMMRKGTMVLTMSKMGDTIPNFWRFVANGAVSWTEEEYNKFLDEIADACETVYEELYQ